MKGFIEIVDRNDGRRKLVNVRHIEDVWEDDEECCTIYMAFNVLNAIEADHYKVRKSYDEIVALIEEAMK